MLGVSIHHVPKLAPTQRNNIVQPLRLDRADEPLAVRIQTMTDLRRESPNPFETVESYSGIDYALRTIKQSQIQVSMMADAKSNIMIKVCSIVVSASLTQLHRSEFLRPILVLDFSTVVAPVAALLCVLPSNRTPPIKDGGGDQHSDSFNLLFFMHFRFLSPVEFEQQIAARFASPGELYRSLVNDVLKLGVRACLIMFSARQHGRRESLAGDHPGLSRAA